LVRTDLPIEQQIVQVAHATHESGLYLCNNKDSVNSLVLCQTPNEFELLMAYDRLCANGVQAILFREPDLDNQATSLCTEPIIVINVEDVFTMRNSMD